MSQVCSIEGCGRGARARGWCLMHYKRWKNNGDPNVAVRGRRPTSRRCTICDGPHLARDLCSLHYSRWLRRGTPAERSLSTERRFWSKVLYGPTDCWLWSASLDDNGYGRFHDGQRDTKAHRFAYEMLVRPIPEGLELDHLCVVRSCVNPSHLDPVTHAENVRRAFERQKEAA